MAVPDERLVQQALEGSQDAYREIAERYQRPVFALVVRMVGDAAVAEELAQDAFVKAFTRLSSFDFRHKFSSWLFKIAHNTTIDHLRRRRLDTVPIETPDDEDRDPLDRVADAGSVDPEVAAGRLDLAAALEEAVGRLRPEYREVILLRFQEGLSYDEIAAVTDLPLGTVKTHIHRARKEMARHLGELGFTP